MIDNVQKVCDFSNITSSECVIEIKAKSTTDRIFFVNRHKKRIFMRNGILD